MSSPTDQAPGQVPAHAPGRARSQLAEQILAMAFARGLGPREGASLQTVLETLRPHPPLPAVALAALAEIVTHLHAENVRAAAASTASEGTPTSWT